MIQKLNTTLIAILMMKTTRNLPLPFVLRSQKEKK